MSPSGQFSSPRRFGGTWAKVEIFLGLIAAGIGLLLGGWAVFRSSEIEWALTAVGLALFVLGGYLVLAGQRSHLYHSIMESETRLSEQLNANLEKKVKPQ